MLAEMHPPAFRVDLVRIMTINILLSGLTRQPEFQRRRVGCRVMTGNDEGDGATAIVSAVGFRASVDNLTSRDNPGTDGRYHE